MLDLEAQALGLRFGLQQTDPRDWRQAKDSTGYTGGVNGCALAPQQVVDHGMRLQRGHRCQG